MLSLRCCYPVASLSPRISRLAAVYDRDGGFSLDNVDVGGLILKEKDDTQYLYILDLLDSRLLNFYLQGNRPHRQRDRQPCL